MAIRRAGYIFVETVVAMGVLSLSTLVIQGALRQAILARRQAQDYTIAKFLLENMAGEQALLFQRPEGSGQGQFSPPYDAFAYEWKVEKVEIPMPSLPLTLTPGEREFFEKNFVNYLGKLTIRITWNRGGVEQEAVGETLLKPSLLWLPREQQ